NKSFLTSILRSNIFAGGDFDIHFIDKHMPSATTQNTQPATRHVALAGIILHAHAAMQLAQQHDLQHDQLNSRSSNAVARPGKLGGSGNAWHLRLDASPDDHYAVSVGYEDAITFDLKRITVTTCQYTCNGVQAKVDYIIEDGQLWLAVEGQTWA